MNKTIETFSGVDIWINNAGVNQPNVPIWEVESSSIKEVKQRIIELVK